MKKTYIIAYLFFSTFSCKPTSIGQITRGRKHLQRGLSEMIKKGSTNSLKDILEALTAKIKNPTILNNVTIKEEYRTELRLAIGLMERSIPSRWADRYLTQEGIESIPTLSSAPLPDRTKEAQTIFHKGLLASSISGIGTAFILWRIIHHDKKANKLLAELRILMPRITQDDDVYKFVAIARQPDATLASELTKLARKYSISVDELESAIKIARSWRSERSKCMLFLSGILLSGTLIGLSVDHLMYGYNQKQGLKEEALELQKA